MRIATFFQPIRDSEHLDLVTEITVPDQSLSVRDILTRFTRGQIVIPPLDTGEDDDIDADLSEFDDMVDAIDSIASANEQMRRENIKNAVKRNEAEKEAEQREADVQHNEVNE